ncbi:MAG: OmpA family protein [Paludibacteraceae bacterium]|nr:OmpA family protein [Paludibacteraceae bacterium]
MPSKVRVYGKAQNRTVLGIINAYLVMYPHATKEDLDKAFPSSELLKRASGMKDFKSLFRTPEEWKKDVSNQGLWFSESDERLKLQDGKEYILLKLWPKEAFEDMVSHASMYGIEVAKFEQGEKGVKGGYRLEYLNGYVPPVVATKKSPIWLWILIGLAAIAILLWLLLGKSEPQPQTIEKIVEVEKVVIVRDTVYMKEIEEIEKNFNAAKFEQGKADLAEDAKFVLHDLAKVMNKNPEVKLKIQGHTSAEGDAAYNQKLSEARAKAAVDFLVEQKGIDINRLSYEGLGSSMPKIADNPMAPENRRTEFIVIE